jgi:hypothetical protein
VLHRRPTPPAADLVAFAGTVALLGCSLLTWYREEVQFFRGDVIGTVHHNAWEAPARELSALGLLAAVAAGMVGVLLLAGRVAPERLHVVRLAQVGLALLALVAVGGNYLAHHDAATGAALAGLVGIVVLLGGAVAGAAVSTTAAPRPDRLGG